MDKQRVAGWVISAIPGLMIGSSGVNMLLKMPFVIEGLVKFGYPESSLMGMGLAAFLSAVLFLIPRTAMVGAILLTGYLGGATATHVRAGEPWFFAVIFGVLVWVGLVMRDAKVRSAVGFSK